MKKALGLLVAGIILMLGPVWGLLGTVIGMIGAFHKINAQGTGNPELLAKDIGTSMLATVAGLIVCPIGILLIVISIIWIVNIRKNKTSNHAASPDPEPQSGPVR